MSVVIETTLGDITVDLYTSERPRACLNFLKLCKIKYYNYNLFHTISRGFIAQTGDPTGSRSGGESLFGVLDGSNKRYFESENEPRIKHTKMGLLSFVGNDERMIGSQFFITLGEDLTYLDQKHCVFGEVVEGFDILEELNEVICDVDDRPYQDVRITHTIILDDPYPNPGKLTVPSRSPSPSAERLQGGRIAPDEEIDETEGKTAQEIAEVQAEREAKARATILEMVGDLPDAEMAPPENVLFVCKLNPVTTDDDLEIIFNRFGKIVSCEVIRDRKTGDSLQYAFIEFSDRKSCEDAYFKMDNILIDDRRIHVDFSQSVSKVKWLGKGRGVEHFDEKGRRTWNPNNSIGKGNYKINRRCSEDTTEDGRQDLSIKNKEINPTSQSTRNRTTAHSPLEDADKENNSRRQKDKYEERDSRKHHRETNDEPHREYHRYKDSSSRSERQNSPRKSYSRENFDRDRRRSNRDRSRSPNRIENSRNYRNRSSRERRRNSPFRREEDSRRYGRDTTRSNREYYHSRNKYENKEKHRKSRSRSYDKRTGRNTDSRYHRNKASSSKTSERNGKSSDHGKSNSGHDKQSQIKDTKQIQTRTDSESSESEIEKGKNKYKVNSRKKENDKKSKKKKVESSSDSDSSEDSDNSKEAKKLSNKKIKKRNISSSDSSGSSDSSESESSSDSEDDKKMIRRKKRKCRSSSESDISEKRKKNKKKK
ncbi:peptidyl-prolyl cis-trans isomerase sig-7 [Diorhabda sublineata]|uniref:peptidyl-prolyl cis-trans isomerase sig-7 n=1 Tax=Diorhabda sublineata TaxID=1163346 RepID=UPI0024E0D2F3|nr:peptidyl-prolyl cis-trans isomerase sig-7 [Diorhabda sublineata]